MKDEEGNLTDQIKEPEKRRIVLDFYDFKPFIDQRFTVYEFPYPYIPSGQYTFPFSFVLPMGLPAYYTHTWDFQSRFCFADISYTCTASLQADAMNMGALWNQQPFTVSQAPIHMGEHKESTVTTEMKCCCCINRGKVTIKAQFDRGDYKTGDVANLLAEIDNTQSKNNVNSVVASFNNYWSYKARDFTKYGSQTVTEI